MAIGDGSLGLVWLVGRRVMGAGGVPRWFAARAVRKAARLCGDSIGAEGIARGRAGGWRCALGLRRAYRSKEGRFMGAVQGLSSRSVVCGGG